ncbi:hypothetical protein CYMTET_16877 [Cymbomonas tetramitiformis]|uniref:Plasmid pRiA4b Orf3-like domain-containing protein n=1 Tax=Cymbomonas tetramitiformis TaxID=36881 RepID=A0AAE0L7W1_9CHLO|nr:hypothetical protein CYMTET_16877 [Cymbomonas tetramitiformis]
MVGSFRKHQPAIPNIANLATGKTDTDPGEHPSASSAFNLQQGNLVESESIVPDTERCYQDHVACGFASPLFIDGSNGNPSAQVNVEAPTSLKDSTSTSGVSEKKSDGDFTLRIHPEDDISTLAAVFLGDPAEFTPIRSADAQDGGVSHWGLPSHNDTNRRIRRQQVQAFGGPFWDGHQMYGPESSFGLLRTPEQQFVDVLIVRKRQRLRERQVAHEHLLGNRLQLKVLLTEVSPPLWRRLTVPASMSLQNLHFRTLAPAIGWDRSVYCYQFVDEEDGALFGPIPPWAPGSTESQPHPRSGCSDLPYLDIKGYAMMDDREVRLIDVINKKGARMRYIYNLAMAWDHTVILEALLPPHLPQQQPHHAPSYGQVVLMPRPTLMDGAMHCPPDLEVSDELAPGGIGNSAYQHMLHVLLDPTNPLHPEVLYLASEGLNSLVKPFDPFFFKKSVMQKRMDSRWNAAPLEVKTLPAEALMRAKGHASIDAHLDHQSDTAPGGLNMRRLDTVFVLVVALLAGVLLALAHDRGRRRKKASNRLRAISSERRGRLTASAASRHRLGEWRAQALHGLLLPRRGRGGVHGSARAQGCSNDQSDSLFPRTCTLSGRLGRAESRKVGVAASDHGGIQIPAGGRMAPDAECDVAPAVASVITTDVSGRKYSHPGLGGRAEGAEAFVQAAV